MNQASTTMKTVDIKCLCRQIGIKANLFPAGVFKPTFHENCRYAVVPVEDELPHYKGYPAAFGGTDETVGW